MPIPTGDLSAANDPFTVGYAAILTALAAFPPWAAAVRPGNVVDITNPTFGRSVPAGPPPADQAQFRLVMAAGNIGPFEGTSTTWECWQEYRLEISTGTARPVQMNQVKFLVGAAIRRAGPELNCFGLIRDVQVRSEADDDDGKPIDPTATQGKRPRAWTAACTVRVLFTIGDDYLAQIFPPIT